MSTITTLNASDDGSVSRGVINTNFSNLNTDKLEAATSATLTNKTIDASNNTISNLDTTMVVGTALTGSDLDFVTGTAGTSGNLIEWNGDGDAIDSGFAVESTVSGNADKVPSSSAVAAYVGTNTNRSMFVPCLGGNGGTMSYLYGYNLNTQNDDAYFNFVVPSNYSGTPTVYLWLRSNTATAGTSTFTSTVNWGDYTAGQLWNNTSDADTYVTSSLAQNVGVAIDVSSSFTGMAAGDVVSAAFNYDSQSGASYDVYVTGLTIEW